MEEIIAYFSYLEFGGVLPLAEDFFSPPNPVNFHPPTKQQRARNQPIKGFFSCNDCFCVIFFTSHFMYTLVMPILVLTNDQYFRSIGLMV